MKFIKKATILLLLFLLTNQLTLAKELQKEKEVIKVGISNQGFSDYKHTNASFISNDDVVITDMDTNNTIELDPNRIIEVSIYNYKFSVRTSNGNLNNAKGPIVITPKNNIIGIRNLNRKGDPAYYWGLIELVQVLENKFNIVNVLDMQTYVKGVVPNEMPIRFGYEALRAQAVAARNYANRPQSAYHNFDICDSTSCQVYYGKNSQTEISDKAVDTTQGIYALYDFLPIVALYHSTSGGITEDWKNVYAYDNSNFADKPYLKAVSDYKEQAFLTNEEEIKEYYSNIQPSYDLKSHRYRWKVVFDKTELENVLNKTLVEQSKTVNVEPKFYGQYRLKDLKNIRVTKRGKSGKALEIEIIFANGKYKVKKELTIRRVLKKDNRMLASGNFFIEKFTNSVNTYPFENNKKDKENAIDIIKNQDKPKKEEKPQEPLKTDVAQGVEVQIEQETKEEADKSEIVKEIEKIETNQQDVLFDIAPAEDKKTVPVIKSVESGYNKIVFIGAGYGHGVGMSQYGASFMAEIGKNFRNILRHYYTGITLGTMQKQVEYNPYGLEYKTDFYYSKDDKSIYNLVLTNKNKISDLSFKINDTIFNPDIKKYSANTLEMDISKYLKEGKNTIVFSSLSEKDKDKTLIYQIEIKEEEKDDKR